MNAEQALAEIEDLIRTTPPRNTLRNGHEQQIMWLGRAGAVLGRIAPWDDRALLDFNVAKIKLQGPIASSMAGETEILTILRRLQYTLRMETTGPLATIVPTGSVFDYFDEIRKIIEQASTDILFVDPYLDAEFVSRYLVHVKTGANIRLLTSNRLPSLLAAAKLFVAQNSAKIEVRSSKDLHDRFVFVDNSSCYHSGASFKDGACKSPATLTQIVDAFSAMQATYEGIWISATAEVIT